MAGACQEGWWVTTRRVMPKRLSSVKSSMIRAALADYGSDADVRYDPGAAGAYAAYMLERIERGS